MEWLKYGMEYLMYGMEQIFHIPHLHILIWCCWSLIFLSVEHISKQRLNSTRTVIRKLRVFFVISVTNSYVDAKRRPLILILFSWEQGTLSPDFCMFTSVLPACHCVRRDHVSVSWSSSYSDCLNQRFPTHWGYIRGTFEVSNRSEIYIYISFISKYLYNYQWILFSKAIICD